MDVVFVLRLILCSLHSDDLDGMELSFLPTVDKFVIEFVRQCSMGRVYILQTNRFNSIRFCLSV